MSRPETPEETTAFRAFLEADQVYTYTVIAVSRPEIAGKIKTLPRNANAMQALDVPLYRFLPQLPVGLTQHLYRHDAATPLKKGVSRKADG